MQENNVERIVFVDDKENKLNKEILKEYIIVTNGGNSNIEDTNVAEIGIFNGGACLITYIEVDQWQEIDSSSLDIPSSVGFISSYGKWKKFLSDIEYIATSKVETQKVVQIYKDGKTAVSMIAIIEFYKAKNPENAWEIYDKDKKLI